MRSSLSALAAALAMAVCGQGAVHAEESLVQQAVELKNAGDLAGAAAALNQHLAANADDAHAHYVLAWVHALNGAKAEAAEHFQKVIELKGDAGEVEEARKALQRLAPAQAPAGGDQPEPTDQPGAADRTPPAEPPAPSPAPLEGQPGPAGNAGGAPAPAGDPAPGTGDGGGGPPIPLIAGGAAGVILLLAIVFVVLRKRKPAAAPADEGEDMAAFDLDSLEDAAESADSDDD